jgi:antitoxin CcdA
MKIGSSATARKRPVNLNLNAQLVSQARSMTDNLSGVVESLLSDFVDREQRQRLRRSKAVEATVDTWNKFNAVNGSIADEYSSL